MSEKTEEKTEDSKMDLTITEKPWEIFQKIDDGVCLLKTLEDTGIKYISFFVIEKKEGKIVRLRHFAPHISGPCVPDYDVFLDVMLKQYKDWKIILDKSMENKKTAFDGRICNVSSLDCWRFGNQCTYKDVYECEPLEEIDTRVIKTISINNNKVLINE
jgi:hypothetical protein